jgi:hypothetical protein
LTHCRRRNAGLRFSAVNSRRPPSYSFFAPCYHRLRNTVQLLRLRLLASTVAVSLLLVFSASAQSTPSESISPADALRALAARVAAIPNLHGPYRLQFLQDANLSADTTNDSEDSFRKELEFRHIATTEDPAAPVLRVGVSETPTQIVFAADVRAADKDEVRMLTFSRATVRTASLPVAPVRLEKQLVYQTPEHILDASSLGNGSSAGMAVLVARDSELAVLRVDSAAAIQQTVALQAAGAPESRAPRAELSLQSDSMSVSIPGKICQFSWSAANDAKCYTAKFSWRVPPVLTPPCDPAGWKLQPDTADWTTPDVLHVVPANAIQKESAVILSNFPGPILSINGEQNPSSALVVTRNLRTGDYEVYKVTLACGN